MTIANDEQLRQAEAAIANLREGLAALRNDPRTANAYELLSQGPVDQIRQVETEIDAYLGAAGNERARGVTR